MAERNSAGLGMYPGPIKDAGILAPEPINSPAVITTGDTLARAQDLWKQSPRPEYLEPPQDRRRP